MDVMASSSSVSTATQNQTQPEFAFDGLAPESASKSGEPWDIFINHRGCDVKHTLATTIYAQLQSQGFHVFLDKEALEAGDSIPAEIQHAMTTATLHIAIFSPNYAESPWCLAELTFMLKTAAKIIPIFYNVEPSDLRYIEQEKGIYVHAFSEHKRKGRYTEEKLNVWKKALCESSFKSGFLVSNNEDEATVLKNVVKRSLQIMKKVPLWVAEHPLVLDELVQGFQSVATEEGVKLRGIVGMGGSGKTTLAKELYNRNFPSFERCSFVFDVRDAASRNALCEKQKKLLADLRVDVHHSPFDHVDEGKVVLANRLSAHRALIVLDDVDHIDQLSALLPRKDNLGSQSMVIVTSRELGVLQSWGLDCIYHMPALANPHAKQLFCWHAFSQPSPPADFETLVEEFLRACNGLPLSLKVLGAHLYGKKSKDYWKSQLHKIKRILPREIRQILEISYDALDEEDQKMFLDVACFFLGEEKSTAIAAWDGSGWSGLQGFETLVNKCLVELVEDRRIKGRKFELENIIVIRMHDHLRDMGREIASRQSPYRLWCPQQIDDMKNHSTIRKQIRGIKPADAFVAFKEYTHQLMGNSRRPSKRPRFSSKLQILSVKGNEFTEEFASLTEDLVWLRWEGFPLQNLPSWLILKNLRVLQLRSAEFLEELWQDNADPPLQLIELILEECENLQRLPSSIGLLQDLKRLVAEFGCSSLSEEFCGLHSLECLELSSPVLSLLPACFGNLINLRNIKLKSCSQLGSLPDSFSQLIHLEILDLEGCTMLSSLPTDLGNFSSLRKINLKFCRQLSMLPDSFSQLIHLEDLNLACCDKLASLPAGFGNLTSLRILDMRGCQLSMLPDYFNQLIRLEFLGLADCQMLSSLSVDFGNFTSLRKIELFGCKQLSMLPDSFSQLIHLKELTLTGCKMLSSLPVALCNLIHLETFSLTRSQNLVEIVTLPVSLKLLNIESCKFLKIIRCIGGLIKLERLFIWSCPQIEELQSLADLASLRMFEMWDCPKVEKIQGLEHAKSLETLSVGSKWRVPGIQSLENVERLEMLHLTCDNISAVKPCIQSIKGKECPRYMSIEGSVIRLVEPIVNPVDFPDLAVTEMEKGGNPWDEKDRIPYVRDLDAFFIYREFENEAKERKVVTKFYAEFEDEADKERKVVGISYHTERKAGPKIGAKTEKVVWGKRGRVREAFYQLLELLE